MSRLQIAYETIPEHLRNSYTYDQIVSYVFTGFPAVTNIKKWLDAQPDPAEEKCRACTTILAYRKLAIEYGVSNEEELAEKMNQTINKVLAMDNMPLEQILKELGKQSMAKDN